MNTHRPIVSRPRVILALEEGDKRMRRGVVKYAKEHDWTLEDCSEDRSWLSRFRNWEGDGIIANPSSEVPLHPMTQFIKYTRVPSVSLQAYGSFFGSASVLPDFQEIGRLAARHLGACGYEDLGFLSSRSGELESELFAGFERGAAEAGLTAEVLPMEALRQRVKGSTGILAGSDADAREAIESLQEAGFCLPEEFGVVGVGNCEARRGSAALPLSSVDCDFEEIGYRAAAALDALMKGKRPLARTQLVPPLGVVEREGALAF